MTQPNDMLSEEDQSQQQPQPQSPPQRQPSVLEEAFHIINGPRRTDYGHPLDNHTLTANLFQLYLKNKYKTGEIQIDAIDVCFFNKLQKLARYLSTGRLTRDTLVDDVGYTGNIEMVIDEMIRRGGQPPAGYEPKK